MALMGFQRSLAVIIGINSYQDGIPSLQTPVADASSLAQLLRHHHGYGVKLLLNEGARGAALRALFEQELPRVVRPSDRLLLYFAGHGIALNGEEGPEGYLIPQDARLGDTHSYLAMAQINQALLELPCRHFLGILDCCFAGAFRWSSTRKLILAETGPLHRERFDRFIQDRAWQVITSAASDQTALDSFTLEADRRGDGASHSPFAAALLRGLGGGADAFPVGRSGQPRGDGVITASELYLYLRDQVEIPTEARLVRQTPGIFPLKNHDKGEYIFLTPGHPLNLPPAPPLDHSSNPYRGLQAFEEEHQPLFFGRTALTEKLYGVVTQQPLTVVLGASGSGKSSLVKAGLLPKIRQQGGPDWVILPPLRPYRVHISRV